MCTAATYKSQDFYFGRTFDYEFNYGEEVNGNTTQLSFSATASECPDGALCHDRHCSYGRGLSFVL